MRCRAKQRGRVYYIVAINVLFLISVLLLPCASAILYGVNQQFVTEADSAQLEKLHVAVRVNINWMLVESDQGTFNYQPYDQMFSDLKNKNITTIVILAYTPHWDSTCPNNQDSYMCPPQHLAYYNNYIEHTVRQYPHITYWEIWNEENIPTFWNGAPNATAYTQMLCGAYTIIHKENPKAKVLIGGLGGVDLQYLTQVYATGGKNCFDIMNIHPNSNSFGPTEKFQSKLFVNDTNSTLQEKLMNLKTLMQQQQDASKRIWITQVGWNDNGPDAIEKEIVAKYFIQSIDIANNVSGVDAIFWQQLKDSCQEQSIKECWIGLFENAPGTSYGIEKPVYTVLYDFAHNTPNTTRMNILRSTNTTKNTLLCQSVWQCNEWAECRNGYQTRVCSNTNKCSNQTNRPSEVESCQENTENNNTTTPLVQVQSTETTLPIEMLPIEDATAQQPLDSKITSVIIVLSIMVILALIPTLAYLSIKFNNLKKRPTKEEMLEFIKKKKIEGCDNDELKKQLLEQGFQKDDIDEIFHNKMDSK